MWAGKTSEIFMYKIVMCDLLLAYSLIASFYYVSLTATSLMTVDSWRPIVLSADYMGDSILQTPVITKSTEPFNEL